MFQDGTLSFVSFTSFYHAFAFRILRPEAIQFAEICFYTHPSKSISPCPILRLLGHKKHFALLCSKGTPTICMRQEWSSINILIQDTPHTNRLMIDAVQFQALFHSLIRVLFTVPSQYLFAIGLPFIFSFGRNLPPIFRLYYQTIVLWPKTETAKQGFSTGLSPTEACREQTRLFNARFPSPFTFVS